MSRWTHFDGVALRNPSYGLAIGRKGKEVVIIDGNGNSFLGKSNVTLTPGATVTWAPATYGLGKLTPAQTTTINASAGTVVGQGATLEVITSGTTSYTITFGTNIKSTGTLATGTSDAKVFLIKFFWDGTNWVEESRTTAM